MRHSALLRSVVAALLACVLLVAAPAATAATTRAASDHWDLESEGPDDETRELSRVLEAAWPQFEAFFGIAPKLAKGERMRVRLFETADAMKVAIRAGGAAAPESGGYYCPVARTSYAYRQPSRWYTRTLVIHEAAHQFHLRGAAARAKGPPASWWQEGIVEHLSHHTWDGTTLRLGVVPPVTLEDRAAAALAAAGAKGYAVEGVAEQALDRPQAMHLVRWMTTSEGGRPVAKWKDVAKRLDAGEVLTARELATSLGGASRVRDRYGAWIRSVQQPFVSCFVEWDSTGADAVRGTGAAVAACRTRDAATSIEATFTVRDPSSPWRAGLLLHWGGPEDYVIAQIEGGTRFFVDRRRDGAWTRLADGPIAEGAMRGDGPPVAVRAVRDGGSVTFRIGEFDAATIEAPAGPLGLCLEGCTVDFTAIRVKP